MKVMLVNGSPHKEGNTKRALVEIAGTLEAEGVEVEHFWVGAKPIIGCMGCGACAKLGKCVHDDVVNEYNAKIAQADGFIFGSPVHYAGASGALTSFMDRAFYSANKADLAYKPAAAICSARRGGCTATFDQLNKYFAICQMPIVSSVYWNMVHAAPTPEQTAEDAEGMSTMRILAHNMAWLLKCIEAGKAAGVEPVAEVKQRTNFLERLWDEA